MTDKLGSGFRVVKKGAPAGIATTVGGGSMLLLENAFGSQVAAVLLVLEVVLAWLLQGGAMKIRQVLYDLRFTNNHTPKRRDQDRLKDFKG